MNGSSKMKKRLLEKIRLEGQRKVRVSEEEEKVDEEKEIRRKYDCLFKYINESIFVILLTKLLIDCLSLNYINFKNQATYREVPSSQ